MSKETVVSIYGDGMVEVVTQSVKWINRMDKLVEEGHAEKVEVDAVGHAYPMDASLFRLPFYRKPREWTDAQKKAARERLAAAREAKSKPKTTRRTRKATAQK